MAKKAKKVQKKIVVKGYTPNLQKFYKSTVAPALLKQFKYDNVMEIPKLDKIVINIGVGEAVDDRKNLDNAIADLVIISGQKPQITKAKKSISNFKLREGMPIGCRTTLRKVRMWEFLERFICVSVPRIRDFRGLPAKLDGRGNYSMGVREQIIFPEIDYDKVDKIRGLNITFVTTAKTDEEASALLAGFGMPFKK
ncbi:MAG: 50S ribosomal protein L5 [Calditrichaeota bacterium]|nr:MAG: 50S ribosomal protein L5 [Calditrichota bacterium]